MAAVRRRRYFIAEGLINPRAWQQVSRSRFLHMIANVRFAVRTGSGSAWEDFRFARVKQ